MSTFGDLERAFADLYPYRWAFAAGFFVFLAVFVGYGYRMGWHDILWRHRVRVGIIATPVLVVTLWLGWSLASPLFTNTTVDEAFPFSINATVPPYMDVEAVESVMAGMAKIVSPVDEEMPTKLTMAAGAEANEAAQSTVIGATPTPGAPRPAQTPKGPTSTPPPTETPAATAAPAGLIVLRQGQFEDADGFHKGTGTATIYQGPDGSLVLRLEDFKVTNGPELHVVLSPYRGLQEPRDRLRSPGWVDLGRLKGNIGNQNYTIPADVDIGIHNSITIWCKPFNVIFSVAVFQGAN